MRVLNAESSGDGSGPRRPYFLLCHIGDQQSEQEDRGEKSDLEQKLSTLSGSNGILLLNKVRHQHPCPKAKH
jgi:hypothetical protein